MSQYNSDKAKKMLLKRIRQDKRHSRGKFSQKIFQYAAVGLIFLGLGSGYYKITAVKKSLAAVSSTENRITLQLSDGTIKALSEEKNISIVNYAGNRIGVQKGNRLIYHKARTTDDVAYNTISVPYGKQFILMMADGTKVHLNSGTSLKYPVQFKVGENREIFLHGEGYFDVAEDRAHPFIVNTEAVTIRVLGTQFNVSAYPDDEKGSTVLVKGSIVLSEKEEQSDPVKNQRLMPGYIADWKKGTREMKINKTNPELYTGWMYGKIIFNHMPFREIRKRLERHYNVTISNDYQELENVQFTASFDTETIEQVLGAFSINYPMQFTMEKDKIYIEKS